MRVLIVGGGGREHAFAWKCAQSSAVSEVLVAPGNAGTALESRVRNVPLEATDIAALVELARREGVDLTIVGPEAPLVLGIVDAFSAAGLRCLGPSARAARLEGSKAFAKDFLRRHGIPTAAYRVFTRDDYQPDWVRSQRGALVVKASGLASGKGVIIAEDARAADEAARAMFAGRFGAAGAEVVIEEFLTGEEASFIVMADGEHVLPLASSQDHKRLADGDFGPNTGGMGAYSPAPVLSEAVHERVMREIIDPTIRGLAADGLPYVGFLYAGLMIGADGAPKVLEYNCRSGDPETQPIMMRLRSDLPALCEAALRGGLDAIDAEWEPQSALGVVLAAHGYPERARTGDPIAGLEAAASLPGKIFHAATTHDARGTVTAGGRVLCAVGMGPELAEARRRAYDLVECVHFQGMQYRHDIGHRALAAAPEREIPGLTPALKRRVRAVFRVLTAVSPALAARLAARAFLTPRARGLSVEDQSFLATAASRTVRTVHGKVQVYEWGSGGPAVLVLHGWISHAARLRLVIEALRARGLRVVALDAPAHGRSAGQRADLYSFRDALAAAAAACGPIAALLAHSFGALAAASWLAQGVPPQDSSLRAAVLVGLPRDVEYLFESFCIALALRPEVIERVRALFRQRYGRSPQDYSARALAEHIRIPVLLVHGSADEFVPAEHAHEVALELHAGRVEVVAGLSHSAPLRDAGTVTLMADFIREHMAGADASS
jgi:phosphoribosylamine--glycine ligase